MGVPVASGPPELVRLDEYEDVQTRQGQNPELTVFVTISGGGYRAANFALGALLALEQIPYTSEYNRNSNLLNEIDYFSTVSGGGIAAALSVLARLNTPRDVAQPLLQFVHCPQVLDTVRHNNTARLVLYRLKPDVALTPKTSGDELQTWLDQSLLLRRKQGSPCEIDEQNHGSYTLGDVFKLPGHEVLSPYWFMNATDMSNGKIFPFTPATLEAYQVNSYWHRRHEPITPGAHYYDVPLVVGLRSSMNFPAGIPATRLVSPRRTSRAAASPDLPTDGAKPAVAPVSDQNQPRDKYVYLTDGGESDNLGALVAADALYREREMQQERKRESKHRLVIVIDAFRGLGSAPSMYDRPHPPGLFASVLRATSLPLDAHRLRVKENFHHASPKRPSILDVLSNDGDVGVAYVHMERESEALRVGTTLHLSRAQQRALLCAGKRQALTALGETDLWQGLRDLRNDRLSPAPPDELACAPSLLSPRCQSGEENCSEIVSFNRQSKEALIQKLVTDLEVALTQTRNAMGDVRRNMEQNIRDQAQAHFRRSAITAIAADIDDMPVPRLEFDDFDRLRTAVDRYVDLVTDASDAVPEPQPSTPKGGTKVPEPKIPPREPERDVGVLEKFLNSAKDGANRLLGAIADFLTSSSGDDSPDAGQDGRDAGEDTPDTPEDTPPTVVEAKPSTPPGASAGDDPAERERSTAVLGEISEALRSMRAAATGLSRLLAEIPRDGRPGILAEVQAQLRALQNPHDKLLAAVAQPPLRMAENLYVKLRNLMDILDEPSVAAAGLSSALESKITDSLENEKTRVKDELKSRMAQAESDAKAALDEYEDSPLQGALDHLYRDLSLAIVRTTQRVQPGAPAVEVCNTLQDASSKLIDATGRIARLTGRYHAPAEPERDSEVWDLDEQLNVAWTRAQVPRLNTTLTASRLTIGRLECIWPDMNQRDSVSFDAFLNTHQMPRYSASDCDVRTALPYTRACPEPRVHVD